MRAYARKTPRQPGFGVKLRPCARPLDPATDAALDEISAATNRPKSDIAAQAFADYVRFTAEYAELVREAREDFAAGRTFTPVEVAAGAQAIIVGAKARGREAACSNSSVFKQAESNRRAVEPSPSLGRERAG